MPRTKVCPSGPCPDPTPEPPPPSLPPDSEFEPLDKETLAKSIPESIITFKPGPPPKKSPHKAASLAAAAISEEIEEEKNKVPPERPWLWQTWQTVQSWLHKCIHSPLYQRANR